MNLSRFSTFVSLFQMWMLTVGSSLLSTPTPAQEASPFTKITAGQFVSHATRSTTIAWADYNNDGWIDLFVGNVGGTNQLYVNKLGQSFEPVTNSPVVMVPGTTAGAVWGDYDNDGRIDLFVARGIVSGAGVNLLYRNKGGGTFEQVQSDPITTDAHISHSASWADYDQDGWLDLFVSNWAFQNDILYRNQTDGTFRKNSSAEAGAVAADAARSNGSSWADFDNDGDPDLFVGVSTFGISGAQNLFYRNQTESGSPTFEKVTNSPVLFNHGVSDGPAWADYDNDGDLDLFVAGPTAPGMPRARNFLYRNDSGVFVDIIDSPVTALNGESATGSWGDYDNDGWLDLFVTNGRFSQQRNQLFRNTGDGKFREIKTGSVVNDVAFSYGCSWADYNNDGFLDLAVATGGLNAAQQNLLYQNTPNGNSWLTVRCRGLLSNRSAIGTKIKVLATIAGKPVWQLRELSGGAGIGSPPPLIAHFGCGDAKTVDVLRIEWPSGIVEERYDIQLNDWPMIDETIVQVGPYARDAFLGSPVELTAHFLPGDGTVTFAWEFNGIPMPGETNSVLRLESFRQIHEGRYRVRVSSANQSLFSKPVLVRAAKSMQALRPLGRVGDTGPRRSSAYANGIWISGSGASGPDAHAYASADLTQWTRLPSSFPGDVVSANDRFFSLNGGEVRSSRDGMSWDLRVSSTGVEFGVLNWNGTEHFVIGSDRDQRIWLARSFDGENWTTHRLSLEGTPLALVSGNGTNVLLARNSVLGLYSAASSDGLTWRTQALEVNYSNLLFADGRFVAGGASIDSELPAMMAIGVSVDGLNWTKARLDRLPGKIYQIVYSNGRFTALGSAFINGFVLTSTSGVDWTYRHYTPLAYQAVVSSDRLILFDLLNFVHEVDTVFQPGRPPRFNLTPQLDADGNITLPVEVILPGRIEIQGSADLRNWSAVLTTNASGDFQATLPLNPADSHRFYRLLDRSPATE